MVGGKPSPAEEAKRRRLAEALRRNLRLRKAQGKSRRAGAPDDRAGLPTASGDAADEKAPESDDESGRD